MRTKLFVLVLCLCAMLLIAGKAIAADKQDAIVNKLVEKGVITKEEAASLIEEKQKESKDFEKIVNALKGFKFGLLWYLSYQNGETGDTDNGTGYSQFAIKRGYFRVTKEFFPWFAAHMTFDVTTVKDPEDEPEDKPNNLDGSIAVRIKYAYGKFNLPDFAFFTKPYFEVGVVHMPWLDFEEHVNWYRCQDTMFMERNGLYNSADIGVTFTSLFGGEMPKEYQETVNSHYAGRYGSMSAGIYNGGGYHASEKNQNKAIEGRLTIRPLPDIVPGLQLSYFGITGKGNKDTEPDWTVNNGFASFEHKYVVLTGQYYWGKGNQKGDDENERDGYSFFAELKPHKKLSIIGRYDFFDPDTDSDTDKENKRYIVGAAYHLDKQHKNMVLLDYDHVDYDSKSGISDDKRIQLTLQIAL